MPAWMAFIINEALRVLAITNGASIVEFLLKALGSIVFVVIGWIIVHRQKLKQDREAKRRDMVASALRDAFVALNMVRGHLRPYELNDRINIAFSVILALGSLEQIRLLQQFECDLGSGFHGQSGKLPERYNELLQSLRSELRNDLDLAPIPHDRKHLPWFRIDPPKDQPSSNTTPKSPTPEGS